MSETNITKDISFNDRSFRNEKVRDYMKSDREKLVYGVDQFSNEKENINFNDLLKLPFQRYKKIIIGKNR